MSWERDYYDSIQSGLEAVLEAIEAEFGTGTFPDAARAVESEEYEEAIASFAEGLVEVDRPVSPEITDHLLHFAEEIGIDDSDIVVSLRAWAEDQD